MAHNFRSIADVEVVAELAESANVLIEEHGVIKKAPKTAVGGGETWDAIFEIIEGCSGYFDSVDIVRGDYQSLKNKIDNGDFPTVLIKYALSSSEYGLMQADHLLLGYNNDYSRAGIFFHFLCHYNVRHFWLLEDGSTTTI